MIEPPFPLERWCNRKPRRWYLVLALIFVLWGIAGGIDCGYLFGCDLP